MDLRPIIIIIYSVLVLYFSIIWFADDLNKRKLRNKAGWLLGAILAAPITYLIHFYKTRGAKGVLALFLVAVCILLFPLLCELNISRAYNKFQKSLSPPAGDRAINKNESGPSSRNNTDTIISYGDSIGHGYKLKRIEDSYPVLLEYRLNSTELKQYRVRIADGYCPTLYYLDLKENIGRLKPKLVIVEIELCNDISDEALLQWRKRDKSGAPEHVLGGRYVTAWDGGSVSTVSFGDYFFERTRISALLMRMFGNVANNLFPNKVFSPDSSYYYYNLGFDRFFLSEKRLRLGFERMFTSLKAMQDLCSRKGADFLLVILPSQFMFAENRVLRGSEELFNRAESKARELGIPFVSLKNDMGDNGGIDLFFDFCHPNERGHLIIANSIFEAIKN